MKNELDGLLKQVREELAHMDIALDGLERNEEGDFIVPQEVMVSMVSAVHEIFTAWNKAHRSFSMVMASSLIHREETLDMMMEGVQSETMH